MIASRWAASFGEYSASIFCRPSSLCALSSTVKTRSVRCNTAPDCSSASMVLANVGGAVSSAMRSTSASSSRIPWSRAARKSSLRNWSKRGTPYGRELGCNNGFTRSAVPCAEAWLAHMTPSASPPATIVLCRCMRSPSDGSRPRYGILC